MFMMYKNYDSDDTCVLLHDCYADKIELNDNVITVYFDNGFCLIFNHKNNNLNYTVRTDSSKTEFFIDREYFETIKIYVFKKNLFGSVIRKELELDKLINLVNSEKYNLEFIYQYKGDNRLTIFECWIHSNNRRYPIECHIYLPIEKIVYCWNNLCENAKW